MAAYDDINTLNCVNFMTLHYNECVYVCERGGGGGAVLVTSRGVLFKGYKLVLSCLRLSI